MSELKTLLPDQKINVGGELITLRPFSFGQLPFILENVSKMGGDMLTLVAMFETEGDEIKIGPSNISAISEIVAKHWENIAALAASCCDKTPEEFANISLFDGLNIVLDIISMNQRFFVEWLSVAKAKFSQNAKHQKKAAGH